jgi:hypothetical protein
VDKFLFAYEVHKLLVTDMYNQDARNLEKAAKKLSDLVEEQTSGSLRPI